MNRDGRPPVQLSDQQRINWLRLYRTDNIGPATFRDLINRFGTASNAIEMVPELSIRGGAKRVIKVVDEDLASQELEQTRNFGAEIVAIGESAYPSNLREIPNAPPLLTMLGSTEVFYRPCAAMVGARNASVAGINFARRLAGDIGEAGFSVISGLARGIDRAAHEGGLETGTAAVLAGGIDQPYPQENIPLFEKIRDQGGAIISIMPFRHKARNIDFPRRNRIIAGIALGLIVIEAARKSGSLISARAANELGRLVFAVPGSPLDPRSFGTNSLIKDGAMLVTDARDVIEALKPGTGGIPLLTPTFDEPPDLSGIEEPTEKQRTLILEALTTTPITIDELIRHTGFSPSVVFLLLLELDLAGKIERHSGGAVSRIFDAV